MPRADSAWLALHEARVARMEAQRARGASPQRESATAPQNGTERDLHSAILHDCWRRGWICLHSRMDRPTGRPAGEPDFVVLAGNGRVLLVECKTKTGKLSIKQQAMKAQAEKLGHTVHVVRTINQWMEVAG